MLNILKQTNDVEMNVVCIRNKKPLLRIYFKESIA